MSNPNTDVIDQLSTPFGIATSQNRQVENGQSLTFEVSIQTQDLYPFDPIELYFDVFRRTNVTVTERFKYVIIEESILDLEDPDEIGDFDGGGPGDEATDESIDGGLSESDYLFDSDGIEKIGPGHYQITLAIPDYLVPGLYTGKWEFNNGLDTSYVLEQFYIVDPEPEEVERLDPPQLAGSIIDASFYNDMGQGTTDSIILIGHADGITINDPYHVADIQDTIDTLQADLDSPLLRALLEAYNAGCRDIHIVAAAPMREYVQDLSDRSTIYVEFGNRNYYERYAQRLEETYRILAGYDTFDIIVPVDAPFYDALGVDFFGPLVKLCADTFIATGKPPLGVIGSRFSAITDEEVQAVANDARLTIIQEDPYLSAGGKMVLVAFGEALVRLPFLPNITSGSANVAVASYLATSSLQRGLTYTVLPNLSSIGGTPFTKDQISVLSNARINPLTQTALGKRGAPFNVVLATDNTQAPPGSDYWSVVQMRLVARVIRDVRAIGQGVIGSVEYIALKERVKTYFTALQRTNYIKNYTFNIYRDTANTNGVVIDIVLWPRLGINDVRFSVRTGPLEHRATDTQYVLGEDYVFNPEKIGAATNVIDGGDADDPQTNIIDGGNA